jgi:hypothetical protein
MERIKTEIEYLAIPYTHNNVFVKHFRAEVSNYIASELTKQGRIIFAPISAWHHIAMKYGLPGDFEYWKKLDEQFICASKKVIVVMLDGWKESSGIKLEIDIANKYGIDIEYLDPMPYIEDLRKELQTTDMVFNKKKSEFLMAGYVGS